MNILFKKFLGDELSSEAKNEEFDYNFSDESSKEEFLEEYKKFLYINNIVFYSKNRFVTIINSNEIQIPYNNLEQIFKIYKYAKKYNYNDIKMVVLEFLYTYFWGISSIEYKKNYNRFTDSLDEFKEILTINSMNKYFFAELMEDLYIFYKELIEYGMKNNIYIQGEIIERIFNNMERNKDKYNDLIEIFVINEKNLAHIINKDNEKNKHVDVYYRYIIKTLENIGGYRCAKEMIVELNKENLLTNEMYNNIINQYVLAVNTLCTELKIKQENCIKGLADINQLIKEMNSILSQIISLSENQKDKMRECIRRLLSLKRFLLSDENYIRKDMHQYENEIKISNEEILKCKQKIMDYIFSIYGVSRKDFIADVGNALEFYSEYPLQSHVSRFTIDTTKQIYSVNPEEQNIEDNFKKFFEEKGKEYTENHPKLLNKLNKGYYVELLKYLAKTFVMQQKLIILMLGEDFSVVINKLKEELGFDCDNDYATVVNNVLSIEKIIAEVVKINGLELSKNGFENVNKLFEIYKNNNDMVNGLMYINYTLYEKSGINLRNNIMHGTCINTNLDVPLLVSFAGLIFASVLLNEK